MISKNKSRHFLLVLLSVTLGISGHIGYASAGDKPLFSGYPTAFSGVGRVDRVGSGEIVIDDHLYRLSSRLVTHTPTSRNAGLSVLREGDTAGFITESERIIQSLWLLKSSGVTNTPPISPGDDLQNIYQENGVWRN